jgi:hypothetical protein
MRESVQDPFHIHNNPNAYWCADCHRFTFDCAHLVESLGTPVVLLRNWQYSAATWARNILEVTMNTGERFQFMKVPRRLAIAFVRTPTYEQLKRYRFERVRGRILPRAG